MNIISLAYAINMHTRTQEYQFALFGMLALWRRIGMQVTAQLAENYKSTDPLSVSEIKDVHTTVWTYHFWGDATPIHG